MKFHIIESLDFSGNMMTLQVDGRKVQVDLKKISPALAAASPEQRARYEASPSGYGIHWPDLDEDLSIDGLLGIKHAGNNKFADNVAEDGPLDS